MAKAKQKLKTPGDLFPDDMRPDFPGFRTAAFTFLSDLKRHNERAWFQSNRETYEREVRFPLECLVAELSDPAHQLPIRGDPKRNVFRGYRDVRFSKNKTPYKTHAAAYLTRDVSKGRPVSFTFTSNREIVGWALGSLCRIRLCCCAGASG